MALIDKPWTEGVGDSARGEEEGKGREGRLPLVSLLLHVGVRERREGKEEEKKSSVCCCSPAPQAEIRLINSRDNVEMSSMTSILGAEVQQRHCVVHYFSPALC